MQAERWKQIEGLYQAALAQPPDKRAVFLTQACLDDPELRGEVESLLDQQADSFLESAPLSAVRALSAGAKLGNFEIVELLGRGGMGEVWRARDARLKRDVAIKVLPAGLARDPDRIARFEREARAASALNHPNIVSVYDIGRDNGTYWIASELVRGDTLRRMIEAGPLPAPKVIEIATQVAAGLAAAHAASLVHRDLKPDNIMVTRDGHVKILDFGLAKQRRTAPDSTTINLTDEGVVLGTAGYMSPEQVRGEAADHRSDLFSFGVVLYEMLCGKRAFLGDSSVEVMNAVLKDDPRELPVSVPAALGRIVRRCLEKEPDRRFQSAADLGFALQPSVPPSSQQAPRRRTWVKLAIAGTAFAALAAVGWLGLSRPLPPPRVTGLVQITRDNLPKRSGLLSDGLRLFFSGGTSQAPYQVSVKGGDAVPLPMKTEGNVDLLDISPDRMEFLVCRYAGGAGCELWAEPTIGGIARRLGNLVANNFAAAWSPDGQQLVYAQGRELHLARSDGTEIRKLATVEDEPSFPRWSPDGRVIRFSAAGQLWEAPVYGAGLHRVFPGWNPSGGTCCGNWTPDGKYFVFRADGGIWAVREKAGLFRRASDPVHLDTGLLDPISPLPSADGKRLFFVGLLARNEFVRFDLKSSQFALDLAGVSGTDLEFSRDGKWVTYVSVPEGSLFRSAPDGSQRLQLTSSPLQASMPHWSPDGKQVAFHGSPPGKPDRIYIVPFEGGTPRQVTSGESWKNGDWDASWSPDGMLLAFGASLSEDAAKGSIHVLDLKTDQVSALPGSEGMWSPRWSPDGRFIAGLKGPSGLASPLALYDVRARRQTELSHLLGGYPSWTRDGESLFFTGPESTWWRVRIRDRHVERVRSMKDMRLAGWGWFATAPNNSLITARNTGTEEIYALDWEAP